MRCLRRRSRKGSGGAPSHQGGRNVSEGEQELLILQKSNVKGKTKRSEGAGLPGMREKVQKGSHNVKLTRKQKEEKRPEYAVEGGN